MSRWILPENAQERLAGREYEVAQLLQRGLKQSDIARTLGMDRRRVAEAVSRIKRKLGLAKEPTGQKGSRAEHAQNPNRAGERRTVVIQPGSEAARLMERMQHDPSFFTLQYRRYALREQKRDLLAQISAGQAGEPKFLFKHRAKTIKVNAASGSKYRVVLRLDASERRAVEHFLKRHSLYPTDTRYTQEGKPFYLYILSNTQLSLFQQETGLGNSVGG